MKPVEQDEMFPEGASFWEPEEVTSGDSSVSMESNHGNVGSERTVHADFNNDFGDLFDDEDLE